MAASAYGFTMQDLLFISGRKHLRLPSECSMAVLNIAGTLAGSAGPTSFSTPIATHLSLARQNVLPRSMEGQEAVAHASTLAER